MAFVASGVVGRAAASVSCRTHRRCLARPARGPATAGRLVIMSAAPKAPPVAGDGGDDDDEEDDTIGQQPQDAGQSAAASNAASEGFDAGDATDADALADTSVPSAPEDILSSPDMLKKRIEVLQEELDAQKKRADEREQQVAAKNDSLMRTTADYENFRRRSRDEMSQSSARATVRVTKDFLSVLDDFELAASNVKPSADGERRIHDSYQSIRKSFGKVLDRLGVQAVPALGQPFDPELHSAIQQQESHEYPENVVCMELQRGYRLGDTLIRPTMCMVSTGPGPADEDVAGDGDGDGDVAAQEEHDLD